MPWDSPLTAADLARVWPNVERYLKRAIPKIVETGHFRKEGAVQKAVSRLRGHGFTVFDREAVPGFANQPEKTSVMHQEAGARVAGGADRTPGSV